MTELTDILSAWKISRAEGRDAALATVVGVDGSSYRRPGARLLMLDDGRTIGSVSGGCIERDVLYRAGAVRAGGRPQVVRYDSISEEEAGPRYSLGCGGIVDIFIEALPAKSPVDPLACLQWLWSSRQSGIIATLVSGEHVGCRTAMDQRGEFLNSSDWINTEHLKNALTHRRWQRMATLGGDLFLEYVEPSQELILFGAGADAVPLASLATSQGWRVTVVDYHSSPASVGRQFAADLVLPAEKLHELNITPESAVVVMTHNWNHDLAALTRLAAQPVRYLGVLGPRKRTEQLLAGLSTPLAEEFRYPVGLDIGAQNPQEIALAIVAEITAVRRDAQGSPLRDRQGPIHLRADLLPGQGGIHSICLTAAS